MSQAQARWVVEYRARAATVPGGSQRSRGQVHAPTREAALQAARVKYPGHEHRVVARAL